MPASNLNFLGQRFSPEEWPAGTLEHMTEEVIVALFNVRNVIPVTHRLFPSPLFKAHVRHESSGSMHSTHEHTLLSRATDFFCKRNHASAVWLAMLMQPKVHGVGVYRNSLYRGSTKDYTMFHLDTRPFDDRAIWVADRESPRDSFEYYSLNTNPEGFFSKLNQDGIWW